VPNFASDSRPRSQDPGGGGCEEDERPLPRLGKSRQNFIRKGEVHFNAFARALKNFGRSVQKKFVYAAAKKHELRDDPRCDNAKSDATKIFAPRTA
jgi:ribosomal protein S21